MAAYATPSDVAALCRNLLGSASTFETSTSPTLASVNTWLSSGCSIIEAKINNLAYATPIVATATLYGWLVDLNTLYAAARAEMSRSNVVLSPGERTRGQVFDDMFWKQLKQLETMNLEMLGGVRSGLLSAVGVYAGGISEADRATVESDTDRTVPRFTRGMLSMGTNLEATDSDN